MDATSVGSLEEQRYHLDWYIEHRYARLQQGNIVFLDPVTGRDLDYKTLPECIEQDPICGIGFRNLKRFSDEGGAVNLVFNFHREQDYVPLVTKAGKILLRSRRIGLEWNSGPDMAMPLKPRDITWDKMPDEGMGAYIRKTQNFVGKEKTVPCDIDHPIGPADKLRLRLGKLLSYARSSVDQKRAKGLEHEISPNEWGSYHLGWSAYHYIRGYGMVGTLGYMANLVNLEPGDEVTLVVGNGHALAIPEKLQHCGIKHSICIVEPQEGSLVDKFYNKGMMGRLTLADVEAISSLGAKAKC